MNAFATITFKAGLKAMEVSQVSGAEVAIEDAAKRMAGTQVLLLGGAGRLFMATGHGLA